MYRIAHAIARGDGFSRDDSEALTQRLRAYPERPGAIPYTKKQENFLAVRGLLDDVYSESPERTAYRDLLYPFVAAPFTWTSEPFRALRLLNLFLMWCNAWIVYLIVRRIGLPVAVGALASLLFILHPRTPVAASELMTETLATTVVAGFMLAAMSFSRNPTMRASLWLGAIAGLCVLVKKQFLLLLPLLALVVGVAMLQKKFTLRQTLAVGAAAFVMTCPLFVNSWLVTQDTGLLTGTNGWNDMPAAYSSDLAEHGMGHFYKIRTRTFEWYSENFNVEVKGEVAAALAGKHLFSLMAEEPGFYARIPKLIFVKLGNELYPKGSLYPLFLITFGSLGLLLSIRKVESQLFLATIVAAIAAVAITHGGYGRMVYCTVLAQCVGFSLLTHHAYQLAERQWVLRGLRKRREGCATG